MPRLAIVISAVGNVEQLEGTLVSVLENRPADCEILVALNQPYADPYDLKGEVKFLAADARTRAVDLINRALGSTRAPFVHLLSSGCQVSEGWADLAIERFGDRQVGSVAPLVMNADQPQCVFAAGIGYRTSGKRTLIGSGLEQMPADLLAKMVGACGFAGFYRKAALDFVGGLSTQLGTRQADLDLAFVLRRAGFGVSFEPRSRVLASIAADPSEGPFRQALGDERLFWRNLPEERKLSNISAHAALVAIEALKNIGRPRMITQLAARVLACGQVVGYLRHRRALDELGQRAVRGKNRTDHRRIDRPHDAPTRSESAPARVFTR